MQSPTLKVILYRQVSLRRMARLLVLFERDIAKATFFNLCAPQDVAEPHVDVSAFQMEAGMGSRLPNIAWQSHGVSTKA